jgi:ABC-type lipoprotein export system ATPase subunit
VTPCAVRAPVAALNGAQRVASARALVSQQPIIHVDEPTAPLDSERALIVVRLLSEMAQRFGTAIIVETGNESYRFHHGTATAKSRIKSREQSKRSKASAEEAPF